MWGRFSFAGLEDVKGLCQERQAGCRSWGRPLADSQHRNRDLRPTNARNYVLPMIRMSLKADPELQVRGSLSDTPISAHWDPEQRAQSSDLHTCELMSRCCCKLLLNFLWFMMQQRKQKHSLLPEKAAKTLSDTPIASRGDRGQDLLFENWNTHLEIIHGSKKKNHNVS